MIGAAPSPQDRAAMKAWRAERREIALRLSIAHWSYDRIVRERPDLGYNNRQSVHNDIKAALKEYRERQDLAAADLIAKQELLLGEAIAVAHEIMNTHHVAHGNGRVVRREIEQPDGSIIFEDVLDDGPRLAAANTLKALSESYRKLRGLDAPTKVSAEVDTTVNYVINATPEELEQL